MGNILCLQIPLFNCIGSLVLWLAPETCYNNSAQALGLWFVLMAIIIYVMHTTFLEPYCFCS